MLKSLSKLRLQNSLFPQHITKRTISKVKQSIRLHHVQILPLLSTLPVSSNYHSFRLYATVPVIPMDLSSIVGTLEAIAPSSMAEDWDNVGLLVEPSSSKSIKHIFLTIDLTEAVLNEVLELNKIGNEIGIIVAYHPPIFKPLKRLTQSSVKERIIIKAIEAGIAIYSPHTAHDNLWGGVNDWILRGFDSGIITPLSVNQRSDTFPFQLSISGIPNRDVFTDITDVLSEVNGTPDNNNITVTSDETVSGLHSFTIKFCVKKNTLNSLLPKLTEKCPNYKLTVSPTDKVGVPGSGRLLTLSVPSPLSTLIIQLKKHLGLSHIRVAQPHGWQEDAPVSSIAVCVGSGGSVLRGVDAHVYLSGEMSHHDVLDATSKGIAVLLCEHSNTERGFLQVFKSKIEEKLKSSGVMVSVSKVDCDPLVVV